MDFDPSSKIQDWLFQSWFQSRFENFPHKISVSIKIQDFLEQNINFNQDSRIF